MSGIVRYDLGYMCFLFILQCSCTKCIVNGNGMLKFEMKSINATCKGKSCDGFEFKLCYAKKG